MLLVRGAPGVSDRRPVREAIIPHSGSIAPWAGAPAVGASRSLTPIARSDALTFDPDHPPRAGQ